MTRRNAALKKGWTTALALAAVVTLSACGGQTEASTEGNPAASSSPAATKAPAKIEIKYWYAWGDKIGENNENLVKKFNESQDKIHVTAEYQGTYDDLHAKTQAAFAAKNAPEVTQNEIASVKIFAESGMTQDLTSLVERDQVDLTDFVPGLMGNSYVDDKLYALPYLRSTPLLYLNATLLKQANLDTAGPKTWDELREYSRKLTVPGQRVGISMAPSAWYFEAFLAQSGSKVLEEDGKHIAFNNEAGVNILKYWLDMNKEGIVTIPTTDDSGEVSKQDFLNQRSAMFFSSTADLTRILSNTRER